MFKKIAGFLFLGFLSSGVSLAATEKPFLFHHHTFKKSHQFKQSNSAIDPSFIGTWSGVCTDDGYQFTLKVVIDDNHLINEETNKDFGSNKTTYYLNSIDSAGMSNQDMYSHSISRLRQAANNTLVVDLIDAMANQNLSDTDNGLTSYIGTITYSVKNNQLVIDTVENRFIDDQSNGSYNYSCTINKENSNR
jgi:hypothetical protein